MRNSNRPKNEFDRRTVRFRPDPAIAKICPEFADTIFPLHLAVRMRDQGRVERLIEFGCDVNERDHEGFTPLHWAIHSNRPEYIPLLLDAGADANLPDKNNWTPLHLAARDAGADVVTMLDKAGAIPDIINVRGETPMDIARIRRRTEVMGVLTAMLSKQNANRIKALKTSRANGR